MRTIVVPNEDKEITIKALKNLHEVLEGYLDENTARLSSVVFDIKGLIGVFDPRYKLSIEISEEDKETFCSRHGVDFPMFEEEEEKDQDKIVIIPQEEWDRVVYLTLSETGNIVGINFHYGLELSNDLFKSFSVPCPHLTEMLKRLAHHRKQSLAYLDNADRDGLMAFIDEVIEKFVYAFIIF